MKTPVRLNSSRSQRGYLAVAAIVPALVGFVAYAMIEFANLREAKYQGQMADESGRILQQHTFGVMKLISEQGAAAAVGDFAGSLWLKGAACTGGTAAAPYISSCSFPEGLPRSKGVPFNTTISVTGLVATAVIRAPWPGLQNAGPKDPNVAASVRMSAASYLSGSTPVNQTFVEYSLDPVTEEIVATVTTAPSTDIWIRGDGSNQMNADLNVGSNDIYGVTAIYGDATAVSNTGTTVTIGSAMSVDGSLHSVGDMTTDGSIDAVGNITTDGSIGAAGDIGTDANLFASGGLTIGTQGTANSVITFRAAALTGQGNMTLSADTVGDLKLTNADGSATLIADKIYIEDLNRFVSQAVYDVTMAVDGDIIPFPNCAASGLTPQIFTAISGLGADLGRPIRAFDIEALSVSGGWLLNVLLITDTNTPVQDFYSDILVVTKCT
jgi:hypothetical protein